VDATTKDGTRTELKAAREGLEQVKNHLTKAYDDVMADHGDQLAQHAIYGIQLQVMGLTAHVLEMEIREGRRNVQRGSGRRARSARSSDESTG
jgi:hypothetical protein